MTWNAVRHVPGSSSADNSGRMQVIRDKAEDDSFTTMVYLINAGMDYQFWQVGKRVKFSADNCVCQSDLPIDCTSHKGTPV